MQLPLVLQVNRWVVSRLRVFSPAWRRRLLSFLLGLGRLSLQVVVLTLVWAFHALDLVFEVPHLVVLRKFMKHLITSDLLHGSEISWTVWETPNFLVQSGCFWCVVAKARWSAIFNMVAWSINKVTSSWSVIFAVLNTFLVNSSRLG